MPIKTVATRLLVLKATINVGIAASKNLFVSVSSQEPPGINIEGPNSAASMATGTKLSHFWSKGGIGLWLKATSGKALGTYVTMVIPAIISR